VLEIEFGMTLEDEWLLKVNFGGVATDGKLDFVNFGLVCYLVCDNYLYVLVYSMDSGNCWHNLEK